MLLPFTQKYFVPNFPRLSETVTRGNIHYEKYGKYTPHDTVDSLWGNMYDQDLLDTDIHK